MYPFYGGLNAIFTFCNALESKFIKAYFGTKISHIFSYFHDYFDLCKAIIDDSDLSLLEPLILLAYFIVYFTI